MSSQTSVEIKLYAGDKPYYGIYFINMFFGIDFNKMLYCKPDPDNLIWFTALGKEAELDTNEFSNNSIELYNRIIKFDNTTLIIIIKNNQNIELQYISSDSILSIPLTLESAIDLSQKMDNEFERFSDSVNDEGILNIEISDGVMIFPMKCSSLEKS